MKHLIVQLCECKLVAIEKLEADKKYLEEKLNTILWWSSYDYEEEDRLVEMVEAELEDNRNLLFKNRWEQNPVLEQLQGWEVLAMD